VCARTHSRWMSHVTCEWVTSHVNESRHIWMSHVTYERVTSHIDEPCHIWMSNVTYIWVMSHMNGSCHVWKLSSCAPQKDLRECVPWLIFVCAPRLIFVCAMTHSYVRHDSFICATYVKAQLDRQPARPSCASGHALRGTSRRKDTARPAVSTTILRLETRPSENQNYVFEIIYFEPLIYQVLWCFVRQFYNTILSKLLL